MVVTVWIVWLVGRPLTTSLIAVVIVLLWLLLIRRGSDCSGY